MLEPMLSVVVADARNVFTTASQFAHAS